MDQRKRNPMTIPKSFHPRHYVDRQYISRKEGEGGISSFGDNVDASIQGQEDYIKKQQRKN